MGYLSSAMEEIPPWKKVVWRCIRCCVRFLYFTSPETRRDVTRWNDATSNGKTFNLIGVATIVKNVLTAFTSRETIGSFNPENNADITTETNSSSGAESKSPNASCRNAAPAKWGAGLTGSKDEDGKEDAGAEFVGKGRESDDLDGLGSLDWEDALLYVLIYKEGCKILRLRIETELADREIDWDTYCTQNQDFIKSYPMYDDCYTASGYPDYERKDITFLSFVLSPNLGSEGVVAPREALLTDPKTKDAVNELKAARNELAHRGANKRESHEFESTLERVTESLNEILAGIRGRAAQNEFNGKMEIITKISTTLKKKDV